jgi:hypothetical protein
VRQKCIFFFIEELSGAEICELYVFISVKKNVLGFEVEVDNFFGMDIG